MRRFYCEVVSKEINVTGENISDVLRFFVDAESLAEGHKKGLQEAGTVFQAGRKLKISMDEIRIMDEEVEEKKAEVPTDVPLDWKALTKPEPRKKAGRPKKGK